MRGESREVALLSVGTAVPPTRYSQAETFELAGYSNRHIRAIFMNAAIQTRHLAIPRAHRPQGDPDWFSEHYAKWVVRLGAEAAQAALARANRSPAEVDCIIAASCTGYLCPGLSQHLARELGLGAHVRNSNLVGMGCSAMLPALERARDYVQANPGKLALVVAAEVSSACYWLDESDLESAVGNAIFSDGASAALVGAVGERDQGHAVPVLERFASFSNRELLHHMGFYNRSGRLRVLLSRDVPNAVLPLLEEVTKELRAAAPNKPDAPDAPDAVDHWIVHPGGRKVLENVDARWRLEERLRPSWNVLRDYGNMSSATVLFVLDAIMGEQDRVKPGHSGLMLAIGPGLTCEGALLRWK